MSKGMKRGLLCAAMFVAGGLLSLSLSTSSDASADQSAAASAVRAKDLPSVGAAPSIDDTAWRYRRMRRRSA